MKKDKLNKLQNFVAKHMNTFNRCSVHGKSKKAERRLDKVKMKKDANASFCLSDGNMFQIFDLA